MSDEPDQLLAPWCIAAAGAIEQEIARWAPVPDLADVLARARAEDPDAVPESWSGMLDEPGEIVPLSRRRALTRELPDAGLAMFAVALRGKVEGDLHERGLAEIPTPVRARPRPRTRAIATAVFALAAVVIATVVALPRFIAERTDEQVSPSAARTLQRATGPAPWRLVPKLPAQRSKPSVAPVITPPAEPELAPTVAPAVARPDRTALLDALEREADSRWRAGDLVAAERLLRKIVARAGKSSRGELAYGDLFALARQLRGSEGPVAVWREYLQRFPRGRFAEDARAGLCRHASDADHARTCWTGYLRHHPSGSHAAEARRWTQALPTP